MTGAFSKQGGLEVCHDNGSHAKTRCRGQRLAPMKTGPGVGSGLNSALRPSPALLSRLSARANAIGDR